MSKQPSVSFDPEVNEDAQRLQSVAKSATRAADKDWLTHRFMAFPDDLKASVVFDEASRRFD